MKIQPYTQDELEFAWCNRVYFRFRTHRRKAIDSLTRLDKLVFSDLLEPYGIHILEFAADTTDIRLLASLSPCESVSSAASKIKGRLSKWITDCVAYGSAVEKQKWLGRGYFATTTGSSTETEVNDYLDRQAKHHGYDRRVNSPDFVQSYAFCEEDQRVLGTDHAATRLRYHLVLATQWRYGVFIKESASAVADCWRAIDSEMKAVIQKVSFVPDHVHIAVALHPTVSPASVATALMNSAQNLMWEKFEGDVVRAKLNRLWQASAYVGSFGDLRSAAIASYVRRWEAFKD